MTLREFMQDDAPIYYDDRGLQSALPYREVDLICPHCHHQLISMGARVLCPACPEINKWLHESQIKLEKARKARRITIEIISDQQFYQEAA